MRTLLVLIIVAVALGCGGNEADRLGVGAQCVDGDDCNQDGIVQECLLQFKGGYCGVTGCDSDLNCPLSSACIAHTDGANYCFRICADKAECNANRDPENESNCSSSATFVEGAQGRKACVPPSSGS